MSHSQSKVSVMNDYIEECRRLAAQEQLDASRLLALCEALLETPSEDLATLGHEYADLSATISSLLRRRQQDVTLLLEAYGRVRAAVDTSPMAFVTSPMPSEAELATLSHDYA